MLFLSQVELVCLRVNCALIDHKRRMATITTKRLVVFLVVISFALVGLYFAGRLQSYSDVYGEPNIAQVANACVYEPATNWFLPKCQRGSAAGGLYANNCRVAPFDFLHSIESRLACGWLEDNSDWIANLDSEDLPTQMVGYPIHVLVRRHKWCSEPALRCDATSKENCRSEPAACDYAQKRSIEYLAELGLSVNSLEYGEQTPLDVAIAGEDVRLVEFLLKLGVDKHRVSNSITGLNAIDSARLKVREYQQAGAPREQYLIDSESARAVLDVLEGIGK